MNLYDQSGAPVDVPDDQVTAAIASGQYGLPADHVVHVATADGVQALPFAEAVEHVQKGATIATPGQVRAADLDARYGGVGGALEAGGEGALSGATLGLSDAAIAGLSDSARQRMADVKEAHPFARGAGEVVGTLAPALLTGGLSEAASAGELGAEAAGGLANAAERAGGIGSLLKGAGRVIAAPTEAATAVGSAFERGVGSLVGDEATSLAGRIAQGAAKVGARGVAEGAIYGGGQEFGEQSLGPAPLNGEKLLAAVGHGALLGGLTGAGLGAGGELGSDVLGRLATKLSGTAEERAAKSVISGTGQLRAVKEMERVPGGVKAVGREMLDRGLVRAGDTVDDIAPRLAAERSKVGDQLGKLLDQADAIGVKGPDLTKVAEVLHKDLLPKLQAFPLTNSGSVDRITAIMQDLGSHSTDGTLGFRQARDLRSKLDQMIRWERPAPGQANPVQDALRDVRGALEDEIEQAGDKAGKQLGKDWAGEYRDTKLAFRKVAVADDAAQRAVSSRAANRVISPSDYGVGAMGGAALGILHGSSPFGLAGGIGMSLAHHYLRERGASTAAVYLDKVSQLGAVRRAAAAVDREIDAGVARIVGGPKGRAMQLHDSSGGYQEKRQAIADTAASMDDHKADVERAASPIAQHAPDTAAAMRSAAIRATQYLVAQLPPHPPPKSILPQKRDDVSPPAPAQAAFVRKFDAVHDPKILLAHVHDGSLTRDEVAAVAATQPELLADMRSRLVQQLAEMKPGEAVPYDRKLALSTFLGQPVDGATTPVFLAAMQAAYAAAPKAAPGPQGKGGEGSRGGSPKRKIDASKGVAFSDADAEVTP